MKLLAVFLLTIIFATSESSQNKRSAPPSDVEVVCPTITVDCPETNPGQSIKFKATFQQGPQVIKPVFKWKVSGGKITAGQGSNEITVKSKRTNGQRVTATVEVLGKFPEGCNTMASCWTAIAH